MKTLNEALKAEERHGVGVLHRERERERDAGSGTWRIVAAAKAMGQRLPRLLHWLAIYSKVDRPHHLTLNVSVCCH